MQRKDVVWKEQEGTFDQEVATIEGTLPPGLNGLLMRNGGGKLHIGETRLAFLDGYALLAVLGIRDGKATFRAVHPATKSRTTEEAAGRMLKRRPFTNLPGWWRNVLDLDLGNSASHDSYAWAGALHVTDLGGHYTLSLPDLHTVGRRDWGDAVRKGERIAPMPRDDRHRDTLVAYAHHLSPSGDTLAFVEVDADFHLAGRSRPIAIKGLVHDQGFTERWYVGLENANHPRPLPALLGMVPLWKAFTWRDEAPTLHLVPRGREGEPVRIPLQSAVRVAFHILNAYDDGDEVVIDAMGYEGETNFDILMPSQIGKPIRKGAPNQVFRIRARPETGEATVTPFVGAHGDSPEVSPAMHGRPYSAAWFASLPAPFLEEPHAYFYTDTVARLDVNTGGITRWSAGEGHQLSPPAFAPDPASDDPEAGWVLVWDLDLEAETTDVVVLDASDLERGPLARLKLGVYLPATSHARFAPDLAI